MSDENVEATEAPAEEIVAEAPTVEEKPKSKKAKAEAPAVEDKPVEVEVAETPVEAVAKTNEITRVLSKHAGAGVVGQHYTN